MSFVLGLLGPFVLLLCAETPDAHAARAADIVQKSFVLTGTVADAAAEILGMHADGPKTLRLPWDKEAGIRNCSWGLPAGEETSPKVRRCEDLPQLITTVEYIPGTPSELRLSGWWEDYASASGPGYALFQFSSPKSTDPQLLSSDWRYASNGAIATSPSSLENGLRIANLRIGDRVPYFQLSRWDTPYGYSKLIISIDFDSAELHKRKTAAFEECRKRHPGMAGGPC